jgi:hypothetical protein
VAIHRSSFTAQSKIKSYVADKSVNFVCRSTADRPKCSRHKRHRRSFSDEITSRWFATNGPLLRFELGRKSPGEEVKLDKKQDVGFRAALGSIVPVDHLQIVCNGELVKEFELDGDHKRAYVEGRLPIESTGWGILRAFSDKSEYPILDL